VTPTAISLILLSAALHAIWNFLLKRSGGGQDVVALSKLSEAVVFAPFFLILFLPSLPPWRVVLTLTSFAALGVLANYVLLAKAYRHGDLSFVYPTSRGAILFFLPIVGYLALGERISPLGVAALAAIVTGIATLNLESLSVAAVRRLRSAFASRASSYAVLAGLVAAVYTIWDKYSIRQLQPFAYMYLYTAMVAAAYGAWLFSRRPRAAIATTWKAGWPSIVAIGVLNTTSYLLVLAALGSGVSSYVLGMRQLSIVFGVALGWKALGEPMGAPRATGVALILAGCLLLSLASIR
jgi:drug/metabolite transporter (DMT)-like permease